MEEDSQRRSRSACPARANRERLLQKYLEGMKLEEPVNEIAERLAGLAPGDIEAICKAAARSAFGRSDRPNYIPPIRLSDFEHALKRVKVRI